MKTSPKTPILARDFAKQWEHVLPSCGKRESVPAWSHQKKTCQKRSRKAQHQARLIAQVKTWKTNLYIKAFEPLNFLHVPIRKIAIYAYCMQWVNFCNFQKTPTGFCEEKHIFELVFGCLSFNFPRHSFQNVKSKTMIIIVIVFLLARDVRINWFFICPLSSKYNE